MSVKHVSRAALGLALIAMPFAATTASAATQSKTSVVYVSPKGNDSTGQGTRTQPFRSVNHALATASANSVIMLEPGTYKEMVVITKAVTLETDPRHPSAFAIISGVGEKNAILIKGAGADGTVIKNLTIENAKQQGLLAVGPISNLQITGNTIQNNALGKIPPHQTFEALHLMGVNNSVVSNNLVTNNKDGGIYLTDETGPNFKNVVDSNTVENNAGACGITVTSHVAKSGVHDNTITNNSVISNGASGIILATPVPGGMVKNNTVSGNIVALNASGGIKLHTHAPGSTVSGNVITNNQISANQADQGVTKKSVGISIAASGSKILNTTVKDNTISREYYGIYNQNGAKSIVSGNKDKNVTKAIVSAKMTPVAKSSH